MQGRSWLMAAGTLSAAAGLAHVAVIFGGPDWYRFFGAGEEMALMAERGDPRAAALTAGIAAVLFAWAAYAYSGAGAIRRLPLLRTALVAIAFVYLLRALAPLPVLLLRPDRADAFLLWSSAIVLVFGLAYAIGTWRAWPRLRRR